MPECRGCGAFVSRDFVRVFGDNRGRVEGCVDCLSARDLTEGATAAEADPGRT